MPLKLTLKVRNMAAVKKDGRAQIKRIRKLHPLVAQVGFFLENDHRDPFATPIEPPNEPRTSGLDSNITLASYLELGTARMPARPFIRPALDNSLTAIERTIKKEWESSDLMNKLGEVVADQMIENIVEGHDMEPLADYTVYKKGHSTLLRETDQLLEAIESRVVKPSKKKKE